MRRRIFIILILLIAGGAAVAALFISANQYKNLCAYTERLLDVEWSGCVESAEGDADEYAVHVKLEIKAGYEEEILRIVQNRFGEYLDIESNRLPESQKHAFAAEIAASDILYTFRTTLSIGSKGVRAIYIYIVRNENGQTYLYVMDIIG